MFNIIAFRLFSLLFASQVSSLVIQRRPILYMEGRGQLKSLFKMAPTAVTTQLPSLSFFAKDAFFLLLAVTISLVPTTAPSISRHKWDKMFITMMRSLSSFSYLHHITYWLVCFVVYSASLISAIINMCRWPSTPSEAPASLCELKNCNIIRTDYVDHRLIMSSSLFKMAFIRVGLGSVGRGSR